MIHSKLTIINIAEGFERNTHAKGKALVRGNSLKLYFRERRS